MEKLNIIKIGGNVLDEPSAYEKFMKDFAGLTGKKILVHGGGKVATRIGEQLGIESKYIKGRRVTDEPTLDLVTMVYAGLINKQIVSKLQSLGCNALGATGADGNLISAVKRPVKEVDFGFVGDITSDNVNSQLLDVLLRNGITPVFAPLTHVAGSMLNTNADTIASVLSVAMSKVYHVRLIFCFDKKGVLRDVNDNTSVIRQINKSSWQELLQDGALSDGILPKLENAFEAIDAGVSEVLIGEANDLIGNTQTETEGTLITKG